MGERSLGYVGGARNPGCSGMTKGEEGNVEPIVGGSDEAVQMGWVISGARRTRGWSQSRLAANLRRQMTEEEFGPDLPSAESLKAMISRWENGHKVPDINYRGFLGRVLGLEPAQLGLYHR